MLGQTQTKKVGLKRLTCLSVANAQYFGGGLQVRKACVALTPHSGTDFEYSFQMAPNASTNSGKFSVVALCNIGLIRFVIESFALRKGKHLTHKGVSEFEAQHVSIDMDEDGTPYLVELDGDVSTNGNRTPSEIPLYRAYCVENLCSMPMPLRMNFRLLEKFPPASPNSLLH